MTLDEQDWPLGGAFDLVTRLTGIVALTLHQQCEGNERRSWIFMGLAVGDTVGNSIGLEMGEPLIRNM